MAAIKEFEKNSADELFSTYMELLTADGVFKGKAPCVACGTARTPKDGAHDVIVSGCAYHHHDIYFCIWNLWNGLTLTEFVLK